MESNELLRRLYPIFVLIKKIRVDHYLNRYTSEEFHEYCHHELMKVVERDSIAHYVLVTLLDEAILSSSWIYAEKWLAQSLQAYYFHEQTAGQGLLDRLNSLLDGGDLNQELEEFLYYAYLWRTDSRETDQLFLALKSRLKLRTEQPAPNMTSQVNNKKYCHYKWAFSVIGIIVMIYIWMQVIIAWDGYQVGKYLRAEIHRSER